MEAGLALLAGLAGAMIGLGGTVLTLRSQRKDERERWARNSTVDEVSNFLAQVNELWRSIETGGRPLDAADGPWIACANAYDRASMVVSDQSVLRLVDELWESVLVIRWEQPDDSIWDDEIWPLTRGIKEHVRATLSNGAYRASRVDVRASRLERRRQRLERSSG
jgi:hypothetical protein